MSSCVGRATPPGLPPGACARERQHGSYTKPQVENWEKIGNFGHLLPFFVIFRNGHSFCTSEKLRTSRTSDFK